MYNDLQEILIAVFTALDCVRLNYKHLPAEYKGKQSFNWLI
jgi:hypothetical protein